MLGVSITIAVALLSNRQLKFIYRFSMKFIRIFVFVISQLLILSVFAEENHQDNNDCRRKPTLDQQKYCLAIVHKDGSGCESIKSYELRMHCMHEIADFTRHTFNSYTPMKKDEKKEGDKKEGDKKEGEKKEGEKKEEKKEK